MSQHDNLSELGKALAELDEARVETLVRQSLSQGIAPEEIITELSAGITVVGERFRQKEYFLFHFSTISFTISSQLARRLTP